MSWILLCNKNRFLLFQSLYHLNVSNYHGNAGDSFLIHNGAPFSTIDNDNDNSSDNCATLFMGAWWYTQCHASNLNGHNYGTSDQTPYGTGIIWYSFTTQIQSLKWDIMAIRPTIVNWK